MGSVSSQWGEFLSPASNCVTMVLMWEDLLGFFSLKEYSRLAFFSFGVFRFEVKDGACQEIFGVFNER